MGRLICGVEGGNGIADDADDADEADFRGFFNWINKTITV